MTDFYSVLRTALDRVGAASSDQRDRVYDHVREVMVRKLRNHRPPVGETEIASRIVAFEAAIDRIESEIAEEAEVERLARERSRRAERRRAPAYETTIGEEEDADPPYEEPPPVDDDEYLEDPPDQAERRRGYADRGYDDPVDDEEQSSYQDEAQGPEPMWGVPAIDMAWDESREQWRDVRRPPDPFAEAEPGWESNIDEDRQPDRPARGGRGFLGRRGRASAGGEPGFAADLDEGPEPADEDELRVERTTAKRPSGRRRGLASRLFSSRSRTATRRAEAEPEAEPAKPARGRKGKVDTRETARQGRRAKTSRREARRRGRSEVEENDPIAALASKLEASRNGYERSEPLLLEPPSTGNGLYLPSPDHLAGDEDEDAFEERPRGRGRSRRDRRGKREQRRQRRAQALAFEDGDFDEETQEPSPRRRRGRREKRPSRREMRRARREADRFEESPRRRRFWIAAIFVVAAGILAWSAYVILPGLFSADPDEPGAGTAAVTEIPTPAAPTPAPATPAAAVGDGIVMFAGDDPSVFETGADNPVDYQADGRFVRITSSINTGGAKLIIDPAVANSLAGHQIRVVIEARGAPDQAAAAVRLAYQQDLLILDWRLARLIGEFAIITATWTVPARSTEGTDHMLIEPGVAGDGTAIDIRSIRFEVLD